MYVGANFQRRQFNHPIYDKEGLDKRIQHIATQAQFAINKQFVSACRFPQSRHINSTNLRAKMQAIFNMYFGKHQGVLWDKYFKIFQINKVE